jgi:hypothetical protein
MKKSIFFVLILLTLINYQWLSSIPSFRLNGLLFFCTLNSVINFLVSILISKKRRFIVVAIMSIAAGAIVGFVLHESYMWLLFREFPNQKLILLFFASLLNLSWFNCFILSTIIYAMRRI